jgi:hypothetical protein
MTATAVATGCVTPEALKDISVGSTGCHQSEMEVKDQQTTDHGFSGDVTTWTIECRGKTFLCSGRQCHERD